MSGRPFVRGRPIEIDFLGFKSDTYRLQNAGWEIAEEVDHVMYGFRIGIRHPVHRVSGMSEPIDRSQLFSYQRHQQDWGGRSPSVLLTISIAVHYMIRSQEIHADMTFFPVDATPVYEEVREEDLYDMPYFKPIDEGKEIFLRKASVEEIMQIALDKQEPEQARIRASRQQEARREEYSRGGTTKAKLIMVA